jgi:hypothetical protein
VRRDCTNGAICAAVEVEARKAEHVVVRDLLLGGAEVVRHDVVGIWLVLD